MRSTKSSIALALAALASSVLASPVAAPAPTAAPSQDEVARAIEERAIEKRAATCTFSGSSGYSLASKSKASCSTIILDTLTVPGGTTLDLTDLPDETVVIFQGTTTFGHKEWDGPLFAVSGTNVKVAGHASGSSVLDGQGALYWDGKGSNGGVTKPKFFQAHDLTDSLIENIKILNPPVQVFSINGAENLEIAYVTIDASDGDTDDLGHNTDGFDIGSSDRVTIKNATVYNQDDCVAINSGSSIIFQNGYCSGGHGLSIGSVGGRSNNTVEGVTFETSTVINSDNGLRIKATEGDTGTIKGIKYDDITLSSINKYGILIEQNYKGGDLKGDPTSGIPITDLTVKNIYGSDAVSSSGYDIVIVCGSSGCSDWTWSDVTITGGKTYSDCENVPSVASCS
ncbi:hypothetical protein VPNG_03475 [Cytospora leucostoma]|uniref:endo-polygalacturonase n=1 Tax=Cytospora leucostoma TaxID=1230097 RepID=A0A423XFX7_9PEZI|nr:hypothetical protein VPNG_03475 [Cytospora leucostoma]